MKVINKILELITLIPCAALFVLFYGALIFIIVAPISSILFGVSAAILKLVSYLMREFLDVYLFSDKTYEYNMTIVITVFFFGCYRYKLHVLVQGEYIKRYNKVLEKQYKEMQYKYECLLEIFPDLHSYLDDEDGLISAAEQAVYEDSPADADKIYHLPFDQQYNNTQINKPGEFYALTVTEAEAAGFRRAMKHYFN